MNQYEEFIHRSRYARYKELEKRRETWEETVHRYIQYFKDRHTNKKVLKALDEAEQAILAMDVMPSMRALMTAGPALDRDNIAAYNCAYLPIDHPRAFDETLYILMCGTGVGFSVERQYVQKLPEVPEEFYDTDTSIVVSDSKMGWASAYRELLSLLWAGKVPKWDLSRVRPAGSRLKTFGGRASGPEPLNDLFVFTVATFRKAAGKKLTSLECHDLVCKVADIVVVGGVRRSALISLSNLSDQRMRNAKTGQWWEQQGQRALSNNSVCYTEKPDMGTFLTEMHSMYHSFSGERGIFNRTAAKVQAGKNNRRDTDHDFGCNPCSEIILRPHEFCNLSEVVVRAGDTLEDLEEKVRIATFLGTLQSELTDFKYIRKQWKNNCEEERLLGVSLTGIMDHKLLSNPLATTLPGVLQSLRDKAVSANAEWAKVLGINPSAAITCVKPSGTVSQLVNSASGIHARYSEFYVRTVRADIKDPLAQWMVQQGVPYEPAMGKEQSVLVFSFPIASPKGSIVEGDYSASDNLDLWKVYQDHWCEHKPSCTIHYKPEEYTEVSDWVWRNFDSVSGISFLPKDDHVYQQAPYQSITEEKYHELADQMTELDWSTYVEEQDNTTASQELACTGGVCEIVDL